jgi:hypothetical protein
MMRPLVESARKSIAMNWSKYSHPCVGAVVALQIVEFGHMIHPCSESAAELARCNALPGMHTPEAPMPEGVVLYSMPATVTVTASTSISVGTFTSPFGGF